MYVLLKKQQKKLLPYIWQGYSSWQFPSSVPPFLLLGHILILSIPSEKHMGVDTNTLAVPPVLDTGPALSGERTHVVNRDYRGPWGRLGRLAMSACVPAARTSGWALFLEHTASYGVWDKPRCFGTGPSQSVKSCVTGQSPYINMWLYTALYPALLHPALPGFISRPVFLVPAGPCSQVPQLLGYISNPFSPLEVSML